MRTASTLRGAALVGIAALVLGCAGGTEAPVGSATSSVDVTLQEWAIAATPVSVPSGSVTFDATNIGPEDRHELVVVKTDLALDAVPTKPGGSVDEEGDGIDIIGEVEGIDPGSSGSVTLDLAPGRYLLICNIIEDIRFHYQLGMRSPFEVTP